MKPPIKGKYKRNKRAEGRLETNESNEAPRLGWYPSREYPFTRRVNPGLKYPFGYGNDPITRGYLRIRYPGYGYPRVFSTQGTPMFYAFAEAPAHTNTPTQHVRVSEVGRCCLGDLSVWLNLS